MSKRPFVALAADPIPQRRKVVVFTGPRLFGLLVFVMCGLAAAAARAQTVNTFIAGALQSPEGVAYANGTLYVANNATNTLTAVAADGTARVIASSGLNLPNGVAVDAAGNVYVANTGNSTIAKVTAAGSVTIFIDASRGIGDPQGLAFDSGGNLYVSSLANRSVYKVTAAGAVSVFVDNTHGLVAPIALAVDPADNLYIADEGGAAISKVTPTGNFSTFARGFFVNGGLAFGGDGNLYASDSANSLIRKIGPSGAVATFVSAFAAWGIAFDPSGNLYFASQAGNTLNKVTASGSVSQFLSSPVNIPQGLAIDYTGSLYFANQATGTVGKAGPGGAITVIASGFNKPGSLAVDQTGTLYVADRGADGNTPTISKIAPGGAVSVFATQVSGPLAFDRGGNLFATKFNPTSFFVEQFVKITPDGNVTTLAQANSQGVSGLALDAGGNLIAALPGVNFSTVHVPSNIVKIAPNGTVTPFVQGTFTAFVAGPLAIDSAGNLLVGSAGKITKYAPDATASTLVSSPLIQSAVALALDATGNVYLADPVGNAVFQILLPSPLLAAVLPGSRSVQVGVPATVFATIINTGGNSLTGCLPTLSAAAPAALSLDYRPTDPTTNTVIGVLNQPVTIPANGSQSFVLGFNANAPATALPQTLTFGCGGVNPAPVTPGVNTVDLLFSATPVPDIVALAATVDPGYVDIPGATGTGEFAVATINLGITAPITVAANTGTANLPVSLLVCQTQPATGICLATPSASVTTTIASNATPTFAVFATGQATVANAPGTNRVFVSFTDSGGVLRGATSVAVRTQ